MYTLATHQKNKSRYFYLRATPDGMDSLVTFNRMAAVRFNTKAEAEFALHGYKQQVPNTNMKVKRW